MAGSRIRAAERLDSKPLSEAETNHRVKEAAQVQPPATERATIVLPDLDIL